MRNGRLTPPCPPRQGGARSHTASGRCSLPFSPFLPGPVPNFSTPGQPPRALHYPPEVVMGQALSPALDVSLWRAVLRNETWPGVTWRVSLVRVRPEAGTSLALGLHCLPFPDAQATGEDTPSQVHQGPRDVPVSTAAFCWAPDFWNTEGKHLFGEKREHHPRAAQGTWCVMPSKPHTFHGACFPLLIQGRHVPPIGLF